MKFNKLFMLGLLGLTFAACSDDNNTQLPDKDSNVYVSLSIGTAKSVHWVNLPWASITLLKI